jgi:hypothetical protein
MDFFFEVAIPLFEALLEFCAGRIYRALPKWVRHGSSPNGFEWSSVREDEKRARANALRAKGVA